MYRRYRVGFCYREIIAIDTATSFLEATNNKKIVMLITINVWAKGRRADAVFS